MVFIYRWSLGRFYCIWVYRTVKLSFNFGSHFASVHQGNKLVRRLIFLSSNSLSIFLIWVLCMIILAFHCSSSPYNAYSMIVWCLISHDKIFHKLYWWCSIHPTVLVLAKFRTYMLPKLIVLHIFYKHFVFSVLVNSTSWSSRVISLG